MKVGYVLKKFPRLSETFILNEMLALEEQGLELEVFSLRPPEDETRHGALQRLRAPQVVVSSVAPRSISRFLENLERKEDPDSRGALEFYRGRLNAEDPLRKRALAYTVALSRIVTEREITHLHAHFGTIATATVAEVSAATGINFSFTLHAKDIYRASVDHARLARWMQEARFAVTVCEANAAWLRRRCGAAAVEKLRVLYNGVDLDLWHSERAADAPPTFLAVGRFVEKKGFEDYLRALALVRDAGASFKAYLVGMGEREAALLDLRHRLGLEDVCEMPGALPAERIRELLSNAVLLIAPCVIASDGNRDALPTVLLEAMASATAALTTPVGGIGEIVRHGREGWLVDSGSPDRLARVMASVLEDPAEAERRGEAGRRRAESVFDLRRNSRRLAGWFAECPAPSPAPHPARSPATGGKP